MLPNVTNELLEHYFICLMEARVKGHMTLVELECPGTYEINLKFDYFERKAELYTKLLQVSVAKDCGMARASWARLNEALMDNENQYERYKPYWTFR